MTTYANKGLGQSDSSSQQTTTYTKKGKGVLVAESLPVDAPLLSIQRDIEVCRALQILRMPKTLDLLAPILLTGRKP